MAAQETQTEAGNTTEGQPAGGASTVLTDGAPPPKPDGAPATGDTPPKAPDDKGEGEGAKTDDKAGAPEAYSDFTLPDGMKLDDEIGGEFRAVAKELGLTQDKAQRLVDLGARMSAKQAESMSQQLAKAREEWATQARADAELAERFDENLGVAKRAVDQFATPALKELLNTSGLGNHPEVIRLFVKVGQKISPDTFESGSPSTKGERDVAKRLYPNQV